MLSDNQLYFYDAKVYYLKEIKRITDMNEEIRYKMEEWRVKYFKIQQDMFEEIAKYEKEKAFLANRERFDRSTQTDVNLEIFQKYFAAYDIYTYNNTFVRFIQFNF